MKPDLADLLILVGVALLSLAIGTYSLPAGLVVAGVVVIVIGLLAGGRDEGGR